MMPTINPNENLISIEPPIQWGEIKDGPALSALEMVFADQAPEGALPDPVATGISAVSGARIDSYLDRELQKVVNHYSGHTFSGCIEIRYGHAQGAMAERVLVRGPHVVRVEAVLGWPSESDTDPAEESLMDILASVGDGGAYVNLCVGDFDRPEMRPADETDLPDLLLAWKDAAVKAVLAAQLVAPGDGEYPGTPGMTWADRDGDRWILCEDGQLRLRPEGHGVDPNEIAYVYGPMTLAGGVS